MKIKIFISCLLFTVFFSYQIKSQETKIKWGTTLEKDDSKSVITKVIGEDDDYLYLLREILPSIPKVPLPNKLMLEKCNKTTMEKVFCKELLLPEINMKAVKFEALMMINKKLVLFTSIYNKGNKKYNAFMQHISSDGKLDSESKELDNKDWGEDLIKNDQYPFYLFSLSNDGNKLFVTSAFSDPKALYHSGLEKEFIENKFSFKIIDSELNIISTKTVKFPLKTENFVITNYKLNNDGSLYMLAKFFKRKLSSKDQLRPASKYGVFYYSDEKEEVKEYKLNFDDKYLTDVTFKTDKDENLICAGFYATQTDYNLGGAFYLKIDKKTKEVTAKEFQNFEKEFSKDCFGDERRSGVFIDYNYDLSIILKENGGIVFVGEATNNFSKKFLVSKARFSNEIPVPYLYKDLILININPTGSILWHKKIAKNQVTYLDAGYNSSYFMGIVKNNLYLVFNDNKKNVNIPNATKAKEMDKAENSIPVVVTVDLDHESKVITRKQLVNSEDSKFILCPRINLRVSNQELIILKEKDSSYSFGHINF